MEVDELSDEEYFDMVAKFLSPNLYEFRVEVDVVCPNCVEPIRFGGVVEHNVQTYRKQASCGGFVEVFKPKAIPGGLLVPVDIVCENCGRTWREQVPGYPIAKIGGVE